MPVVGWLGALDAIMGLADAAKRIRGVRSQSEGSLAAGSTILGHVETRLAAVVVAALKEAFDRDSTRLELERSQIEAERKRAEEALRLELLRQAGDRELNQARMIATMAVAIWVASAILMTQLAGTMGVISKAMMGTGWAFSLAALACAFLSHQHVVQGLGAARRAPGPSREFTQGTAALAAPWLLVAGLGFTAASLLLGLG